MDFPVSEIRKDFPVLEQKVHGKDLVYFDNAATTQKPRIVINKLIELHSEKNSSIHRSVNYLSDQMTREYEAARETVRDFIGAESSREIIFTSGATGSINTVAYSFGEAFVGTGDEIIVSELEHHSNIVPWQLLCERKGAILKVLPINHNGEIIIDKLNSLITENTRLVSVSQVSNSMGIINPVEEIIRITHLHDVPVLIDGAQSVQHSTVDVRKLDCDFFAFSGHKIYGPTGIGVLYGKEKWLDQIPPYQGGGDMIDRVSFSGTTFNELPFKFEAGTTNYIGAIGLAESIKYISNIGLDAINKYESQLQKYASEALSSIPGIKIYGNSDKKVAIFSFLIDGIHPYDAGMVLDKMGIAIRTGTHCTMPVMEHFGIEGTMRASMCFYNTKNEIDKFVEGLSFIIDMFS
jgi:cysteine desulfurase/selenocysteine lyase